MEIRYDVPKQWYNGVYRDSKQCCSAARSFSMLHNEKSDECWLLVHGFRGYPGELVRPALDLFDLGFDVFVPRLPGHGTCVDDFVKSGKEDWVEFVKNALCNLSTRYSKVNLLGHSMGASIIVLAGLGNEKTGKMVYVAPSFENKLVSRRVFLLLSLLKPFVKKLKCNWKPDSRYRMHYENAPCDDLFLGKEYWSFNCTKQTADFYRIMKQARKKLINNPYPSLVIYPLDDENISKPSVKFMNDNLKDYCKVVEIEHGTHCVMYDIDSEAERCAVEAIVKFASEN